MMRLAPSMVIWLCLLLPILSCSTSGTQITKPAVTFLGIYLSKEVQRQGDVGIPASKTQTYLVSDKEVVALVSFKNLHGVINIRWEWFSPDGNLYLSTAAKTIKSSEGKYFHEFSAWHSLSIKGDKAATMPGTWSVHIYLNDEILDLRKFNIVEET